MNKIYTIDISKYNIDKNWQIVTPEYGSCLPFFI